MPLLPTKSLITRWNLGLVQSFWRPEESSMYHTYFCESIDMKQRSKMEKKLVTSTGCVKSNQISRFNKHKIFSMQNLFVKRFKYVLILRRTFHSLFWCMYTREIIEFAILYMVCLNVTPAVRMNVRKLFER